MERYDLEQGLENHGYDGPLHVSRGSSTSELGENSYYSYHPWYFCPSWKLVNGSRMYAMKAKENGGVVDEYLNVYGTQNLKVVGLIFGVFVSDSRYVDLSF